MSSELPPVVLLHGLGMSGSAWQDVVPLLIPHHTVYAPSALGHRGGPEPQRRPVTIWDVVDASERYLDENGLVRPHLVGNSMGGFVALELARRGRAATVCALSPGGFWSDAMRARVVKKLRRGLAAGRATRALTPLVMKWPTPRRLVMRSGGAAWYGDRISAARAVEIAYDSLECTVTHEVHHNDDEHVAPLDPLPCPVTVAWAENDILLPLQSCGTIARERLPQAKFVVLPDVGHAPMLDDPELVARTILEATGIERV